MCVCVYIYICTCMYVYSFILGGKKKSKETQVTVELKGKKHLAN